MKSLIIILLALVIAGNVHADDKYGEFSRYLSKELEKQYKLLNLNATSAHAIWA